ncbi:hypothetical protein SDC9_49225 [bioreactor metagenome]|uniref:Uncharacterized protein n=1 Tax=bioreactor metagenome TaxID=1076179 RepID=A0A644WGH2_9ZZZZ
MGVVTRHLEHEAFPGREDASFDGRSPAVGNVERNRQSALLGLENQGFAEDLPRKTSHGGKGRRVGQVGGIEPRQGGPPVGGGNLPRTGGIGVRPHGGRYRPNDPGVSSGIRVGMLPLRGHRDGIAAVAAARRRHPCGSPIQDLSEQQNQKNRRRNSQWCKTHRSLRHFVHSPG